MLYIKKLVNRILKNFPITLFIFTKIFRAFNLSARALNSDFPIDKKGIKGFFEPFYPGKNGNFFLRFYNSSQKNILFLTTFFDLVRNHIFAFEISEAKKIHKKYIKTFLKNELKVIGVSHFEKKTENISIKTDLRSYNLEIEPDRFSYLKFGRNENQIEIMSDNNILINENLNKKKNESPHLMLAIFIDGFNYVNDSKYLKQIAPNTYNFFSKNGYCFNNHFSNAEWTVPSFANLFTGKYTHNHGIFHPNANHDVGKKNKLLPEFFQENGYLTFMCNSGWRSSPGYGYIKGFDRTIYKKESNAKFILGETIEHLNAFDNTNNFCFLGINDLHHFVDLVPPFLSQITEENNKIYNKFSKTEKIKSVEMNFNDDSIEKLKLKTFELDKKLELLYNFIENKYPNHTVTIFADHGHAFLSKEPYILSHYRTSVPWLVRSSKIIDYKKFDTLFTSNIDVLPTLLDLCNLPYDNSELDGKSIFNKSINDTFIIESIYPNKSAHFKIFKNRKFEILNTQIQVDNFGFMTLNKEKNYQQNLGIEKIINNWNSMNVLSRKDF